MLYRRKRPTTVATAIAAIVAIVAIATIATIMTMAIRWCTQRNGIAIEGDEKNKEDKVIST
jgi:hypothetical protein